MQAAVEQPLNRRTDRDTELPQSRLVAGRRSRSTQPTVLQVSCVDRAPQILAAVTHGLSPLVLPRPVNSISWAPHELGSVLACASSDGNVSVLSFNDDGSWGLDLVPAHPMGCNAVSWAPATVPGSLITAQQQQQQQQPNTADGSAHNTSVRRFASAGCDNIVKIWEYSQESKKWEQVEQLTGHTDWVRDVAFAPNIGLPRSYLATCSQDRTVLIWTQDGLNSPWTKTSLNPSPTASNGKFAETVWRVSWSVSGNVLAVSCGDGKVTLWKENLKGAWECCSE